MLALYVEHHVHRCLRPILFDDEDPLVLRNIVAPARCSQPVQRKACSKRSPDALPVVHCFRILLADLGTICRQEPPPPLDYLSVFVLNFISQSRADWTILHRSLILGFQPVVAINFVGSATRDSGSPGLLSQTIL